MGLNVTREPAAPMSHANWMGGPSFDVKDPLFRLRLTASSCFFGEPKYYPAGKRPAVIYTPRYPASPKDQRHLDVVLGEPLLSPQTSLEAGMTAAIDAALDHDPEATLREAVRLRGEEHMRATPQVILVRAAHHARVRGSHLLATYARKIILRADEPAAGLAYHIATYGKDAPIPNALKRVWRTALEGFDAYQLGKYRMEGRGVKTVDVVNLVHPRGEAVNALVRGKLKTTGETWEAIVSAKGSTKEAWTEALGVMGHMALLRNLRNMIRASVDLGPVLDKLVSTAASGKQMPFRYVSAFQAVENEGAISGAVLDAIEACLKASLGNLPTFAGRVMSLCDNSGSAQGAATSSMGSMKVSTIANLTGILAGMRAGDGHLGVFGDKLETFVIRKAASIFDQLAVAERHALTIGQGTETGVWTFWERAIAKAEHWDHVFVFSDMQAGHGGLYGQDPSAYRQFQWPSSGMHIDVPKLVQAYRRAVNPKVQVYLVQVAGYEDTILPEFYPRTYILGGWSEGLLRFAAEMANLLA